MTVRQKFSLLLFSVLAAACATQPASNFSAPASNQIGARQTSVPSNLPQGAGAQLQVVIVPSEVIVGANRFAIGLIDPQRGMIREAAVHFRYYDLSDPNQPKVESESEAVRLAAPDGESVIYAQEREFNRAGQWGVDVQARLPDGTNLGKRIAFQVISKSPTLKPGDRVPSVETRTLSTAGDPRKLTSAPHPNLALYGTSLAQAVANSKPTVLLFATPAFCQTRLCGPAYDIISALQSKYGDAAIFIHIEVYTGLPNPVANNWEVDPAMTAFGLQTEPWVYLIDKGVVTYRVEGLFTPDEIERQLKPLLGM